MRFSKLVYDLGELATTLEFSLFTTHPTTHRAAIGRTKIAAVCTFQADLTADELVEIVTAHQDALHHGAACALRQPRQPNPSPPRGEGYRQSDCAIRTRRSPTRPGPRRIACCTDGNTETRRTGTVDQAPPYALKVRWHFRARLVGTPRRS